MVAGSIFQKLKNIYFSLENKYYEVVEAAVDKGVPLDRVISPIEEKGVPTFPIVATLIIILVLAPLIALAGHLLQPTYEIQVFGPDGKPYRGTIYLDGQAFVPDNQGYVRVHFKPSTISVHQKGVQAIISPDFSVIHLKAETHELRVRALNTGGDELTNAVVKVFGKNGVKTVIGSPAYFKLSYAGTKDVVVPYDDGHVDIQVIADGYEDGSATASWDDGESITKTVVLKKKELPKGAVTIVTEPRVNGYIRLYRNGFSVPGGEGIINDGSVRITGIPYGTYQAQVTIFLDNKGEQKYVSPNNRFTIVINQPNTTKTLKLSIPPGMIETNEEQGSGAEVKIEENVATIKILTEPSADGEVRLAKGGTYLKWGAKLSNGSATIDGVPYDKYELQVILDVNGKKVVLKDNVFPLTVNKHEIIKTLKITVPKEEDVQDETATIYVFDADENNPVENAEIIAIGENKQDVVADTNADGYAKVYVKDSMKVIVQKGGYISSRSITIQPRNTYKVPLKPAPKEGNIVVAVKNPIGQPVAGATVILKDSEDRPIKQAYTGSDGKATITHVPEGEYTIIARFGPQVGKTSVYVSDKSTSTTSIRLDLYVKLGIHVTMDYRGAEIPIDAEVKAINKGGMVVDEKNTGSDGYAELTVRWNEPVQIYAHAVDENGQEYNATTQFKAYKSNANIDIVINRKKEPKKVDYSALIYVYDVDENKPIQGAEIVDIDEIQASHGETNADGYAKIFVDENGVKVMVKKDGYFHSREFTVYPQKKYRVGLKQTPNEGNLLVTVYGITGLPVGGATVKIYDQNGTLIATGYTDDVGEMKGKVLFTHVPAGRVTAAAALAGLYEAEGTAEIEKDKQTEIELNLDMYAHLHIQVNYIVRGERVPVPAHVRVVTRAENNIFDGNTNSIGQVNVKVPANLEVKIIAEVHDAKDNKTYSAATEYTAYTEDRTIIITVQKPGESYATLEYNYAKNDAGQLVIVGSYGHDYFWPVRYGCAEHCTYEIKATGPAEIKDVKNAADIQRSEDGKEANVTVDCGGSSWCVGVLTVVTEINTENPSAIELNVEQNTGILHAGPQEMLYTPKWTAKFGQIPVGTVGQIQIVKVPFAYNRKDPNLDINCHTVMGSWVELLGIEKTSKAYTSGVIELDVYPTVSQINCDLLDGETEIGTFNMMFRGALKQMELNVSPNSIYYVPGVAAREENIHVVLLDHDTQKQIESYHKVYYALTKYDCKDSQITWKEANADESGEWVITIKDSAIANGEHLCVWATALGYRDVRKTVTLRPITVKITPPYYRNVDGYLTKLPAKFSQNCYVYPSQYAGKCKMDVSMGEKLKNAIKYDVTETNTNATITITEINFEKLGKGDFNITIHPSVELKGGGIIDGAEYNITIKSPEPWQNCFEIELNAPELAAMGDMAWAIKFGLARHPEVTARVRRLPKESCNQYTAHWSLTASLSNGKSTPKSRDPYSVSIPDPAATGVFPYTAVLEVEVNAANNGGHWEYVKSKHGTLIDKIPMTPTVKIELNEDGNWIMKFTNIPDGCSVVTDNIVVDMGVTTPDRIGLWIPTSLNNVEIYGIDRGVLKKHEVLLRPLVYTSKGYVKSTVTFDSTHLGSIYLPEGVALKDGKIEAINGHARYPDQALEAYIPLQCGKYYFGYRTRDVEVNTEAIRKEISIGFVKYGTQLTLEVNNNTPFDIQPQLTCTNTISRKSISADGISIGGYESKKILLGYDLAPVRPAWSVQCTDDKPTTTDCDNCVNVECNINIPGVQKTVSTGTYAWIPTIDLKDDPGDTSGDANAPLLGYIYDKYLQIKMSNETPYTLANKDNSNSNGPCSDVNYNTNYDGNGPADIYAVVKYMAKTIEEWNGLLAVFDKHSVPNYVIDVDLKPYHGIQDIKLGDDSILSTNDITEYNISGAFDNSAILVFMQNNVDLDQQKTHYYEANIIRLEKTAGTAEYDDAIEANYCMNDTTGCIEVNFQGIDSDKIPTTILLAKIKPVAVSSINPIQIYLAARNEVSDGKVVVSGTAVSSTVVVNALQNAIPLGMVGSGQDDQTTSTVATASSDEFSIDKFAPLVITWEQDGKLCGGHASRADRYYQIDYEPLRGGGSLTCSEGWALGGKIDEGTSSCAQHFVLLKPQVPVLSKIKVHALLGHRPYVYLERKQIDGSQNIRNGSTVDNSIEYMREISVKINGKDVDANLFVTATRGSVSPYTPKCEDCVIPLGNKPVQEYKYDNYLGGCNIEKGYCEYVEEQPEPEYGQTPMCPYTDSSGNLRWAGEGEFFCIHDSVFACEKVNEAEYRWVRKDAIACPQ